MASPNTQLASVLTKKRFPGAFVGEPIPTTSIADILNDAKLSSVLVKADFPNAGIP
jgi:hypothetical protein